LVPGQTTCKLAKETLLPLSLVLVVYIFTCSPKQMLNKLGWKELMKINFLVFDCFDVLDSL
jgi:hypothetical protein